MKLLIVIPALNEEASIEAIIRRALAARAEILARAPVTAVDITVVSDGSTDRTAELAARYTEWIRLVVFDRNRGYGAAIKTAWAESDAEILGFLDADGTCDPRFFAPLCQTLVHQQADVVLGCRLNARSRMPALRRAGNQLFAALLTLLSSSPVRDTASGMRVVRRAALPRLLPLPDGLHFTPAMSARALLRADVRVVEIDMPYHERAGRSKLRAGRDGLRFLRVILEAAFLYRPARPLALLGAAWLALAVLLMEGPTLAYLGRGTVEEWMIYRFLFAHLAGVATALFLCAAYLADRAAAVALGHRAGSGPAAAAFFSSRLFWLAPLALLTGGGLLVLPGFLELVRGGATSQHWSRFIAMSLCWSVAFVLLVTKVVDYVLGLVAAQLRHAAPAPPGRVPAVDALLRKPA